MKSTTILAACIFFFSMIAFSCGNSDDDLNPTNNNSQVLTQGGTWKVTWYWDKDKEETSDFSGYSFKFLSNGDFEATRNGTLTTGTWQITNSIDSSQRLVIASGSAVKPLSNLDDDWIIVSMTDNKIELKDDSPEHLEELHFEKQ